MSRGRVTSGPEHPHVRGEDQQSVPGEALIGGAPPRAWGGPRRHPDRTLRYWSTPTCVGRTPDATYGYELIDGAPPRAWGGRGVTGWPPR